MYTWIEEAPQKLSVDAGLGYAHEDRVVGQRSVDGDGVDRRNLHTQGLGHERAQ